MLCAKRETLESPPVAAQFIPARSADMAIDVIDGAGALPVFGYKVNQQAEMQTIDIHRTISRWSSKIARIPERSVTSSEKDKLATLEASLKQEVSGGTGHRGCRQGGQTHPRRLQGARQTYRELLCSAPWLEKRTCRQLSKHLGVPLHRFRHDEYQEKHTVSR